MATHRSPRLGQHFLTHRWAAVQLAHAVSVRRREVFLEIGPGKGVLTRELLRMAPVLAVEKDPSLAARLRATFAEEIASGRLTLLEQDIRDFDPAIYGLRANAYVLAANIPYYITGEIIRKFLTADARPRAMAVLVQREVADRIVARDGKESILSISVKAYGTPRIVGKVSRSHFSPPPKVDSAIIAIDGISNTLFTDIGETDFFEVVHAGFASKRKLVANNLAALRGKRAAQAACLRCGGAQNARAENITVAQWKCLALSLTAPARA